MIRRRESTIKSRILEEEDDDENSQGSANSILYGINLYDT